MPGSCSGGIGWCGEGEGEVWELGGGRERGAGSREERLSCGKANIRSLREAVGEAQLGKRPGPSAKSHFLRRSWRSQIATLNLQQDEYVKQD